MNDGKPAYGGDAAVGISGRAHGGWRGRRRGCGYFVPEERLGIPGGAEMPVPDRFEPLFVGGEGECRHLSQVGWCRVEAFMFVVLAGAKGVILA